MVDRLNFFKVWKEQKEREYFDLGHLLVSPIDYQTWKYALSFCSTIIQKAYGRHNLHHHTDCDSK